MASSNVCWGIEVGAGALKALKLGSGAEGHVQVLDFAVIQHNKVLSTPHLDRDDAVRIALGTLTSQHDLSGTSVAVSVPGHSSFARFAKLPPVEPKKVPDIVRFEAVQQIPFPIEEVEWDFQTFVSPDSPDVEVGIFAVTRDRIMQKLVLFHEFGITPDYVNLSPVALYNALAYDLEFTSAMPGTVILDVGTISTDLIIADAGRVWIRTFPVGGHNFTEALVEAFKLSYVKAEKLKREAGQSKHARHIFQAMRPIFADLAQETQRSLGFYQSMHKDARLVRLIGAGSTFKLPGLRRYLKQQLQMEVYRKDHFKRLSVDGPKSGEFQAACVGLGTCYGLALQGLGLESIQANLMPVPVIRRAMWRRKTKWFAAAAALSVTTGGFMFIRPFLDQSAIAANPPDTIIDRAKSDLDQAKRYAQQAGVVSGGTPDYSAANMIALLENREVYGYLVNDLGLIFADAERVAKQTPLAEGVTLPPGPIAWMETFQTQYIPAGGDAPESDRGGRRGRGRGGEREGGREAAAQPSSSGTGGGNRRIHVQLTLKTTHPDAQRFILRSADQWLRSNAVREGVPYRIAVGEQTWQMIEKVEVGQADEQAPATRRTASAREGRSGRSARSSRGGARDTGLPPGFKTRAEYEQALSETVIIGEEPERQAPPATRRQGAQRRQPKGRNAAAVNGVAPLPPKPPEAQPGQTITTFTLEWDAVLGPFEDEGDAR